jgi:hypothetical protein
MQRGAARAAVLWVVKDGWFGDICKSAANDLRQKGGVTKMKRGLQLVTAALVALSLTACAATTEKHSYRSIKCPACGYEFDRPTN